MKVFVGWAYEADWVEEYAIPLIQTYGVEVLTGKELQGEVITGGVKDRINEAEGAVFFTTRRREEQDGTWQTSEWVVDEIKYALAQGKERVLELREAGVTYPNKINEERQYILVDPADHHQCLVELGRTISRWRGLHFKLQLLPQEFIQGVRTRINQNRYACSYAIRKLGRIVYGPEKAEIVREGQGFFVYAYNLPRDIISDAFIEVEVDIGDLWSAYGVPLGALEINLEKQ